MLGACYTALLERSGIDPATVEDLVIGCTAPFGEQSRNIGRNAWLQAGYPAEVPATTLDRRCGSAQTAVEMAAALVASGTHDLVIAGGVEHMGHVPMNSPGKIVRALRRALDGRAARPLRLRRPGRQRRADRRPWEHLAARRWTRSRSAPTARRRAIDARAGSTTRWSRYQLDGQSATPTRASGRARRVETLAGLKPVVPAESGRITAGTSSQICDGAAAVLLRSRDAARAARPAAARPYRRPGHRRRRPDHHAHRADPGDAEAARPQRPAVDDIDLFEVNEAFASVVLAWQQRTRGRHGPGQRQRRRDRPRPPVGATGARLIATLARTSSSAATGELGLVTMCCGGGLGRGR